MEDNVLAKKGGKKKVVKWIIIGAVIIAAAIVASVIILSANSGRSIKRELNLAEKYVTELDYESAIAAYKKVIELDSENVEAYIGIVNCYRSVDDIKSAYKWAKKGYKATDDDKLKDLADELDKELSAEKSSDTDEQGTSDGSDSGNALGSSENTLENSENTKESFENAEGSRITQIEDNTVFDEYDTLSFIGNGIAVVSKGGLYGAVKTDGEVIVPLTYDSSEYFYAPDENGHFVLSDGTNYYLYDGEGTLITTSEDEIIRHDNYYILEKHILDPYYYNDPNMLYEDYTQLYTGYSGAIKLTTYEYYTYDNQFVLSTNVYEFTYDAMIYYYPSSTSNGGELVYDIELVDESELGITEDDKYNLLHQYCTNADKEEFESISSVCVVERTGILDADGNVNWIETYKGPGCISGSGQSGAAGWCCWMVTGLSYPISSYIDGAVLCATGKLNFGDNADDNYGEYCLRKIDFETGTFSNFDEIEGKHSTGYNYYLTGIWGRMCNYGSKVEYTYTDGGKTEYILDDITDNGVVNIGSYDYLAISEEKYWLIESEDSWGYIDHDGNVAAMYDDASAFTNGFAGVIKDGVGYVIDDSFNIVEENIPAIGCVTYEEAIIFTTEDGYIYYLTDDND